MCVCRFLQFFFSCSRANSTYKKTTHTDRLFMQVAPTTPPPPARASSPPPHKKTQRSSCIKVANTEPRRLVDMKILVDRVNNVNLGVVMQSKVIQNKMIIVSTTHTVVLCAADETVIEIHPSKPEILGHTLSFENCF